MKLQEKSNSITKALKILSVFAPDNEEMGTVEISQKLGFHKATVSRILATLTEHSFLRQNPKTKKFLLGPSVMSLARAVNQSLKTNLVQLAKPYIDELRDTVEESAILEVLSGGSAFMAYIAEGHRMVRLAGSIGDRVPPHASAGSKTILAFSSPETQKSLLKKKMHRFTKNTITDRRKLESELMEIREQGIAFDHEEIDEGTSAVGAPILNHEGIPIGAVVVAGPTQRINDSANLRMISALKKAAAKVSSQLLYKKPGGDDGPLNDE